MLAVIKHIVDDSFVFQRHNALVHNVHHTVCGVHTTHGVHHTVH